jgi:hypothetical protein
VPIAPSILVVLLGVVAAVDLKRHKGRSLRVAMNDELELNRKGIKHFLDGSKAIAVIMVLVLAVIVLGFLAHLLLRL